MKRNRQANIIDVESWVCRAKAILQSPSALDLPKSQKNTSEVERNSEFDKVASFAYKVRLGLPPLGIRLKDVAGDSTTIVGNPEPQRRRYVNVKKLISGGQGEGCRPTIEVGDVIKSVTAVEPQWERKDTSSPGESFPVRMVDCSDLNVDQVVELISTNIKYSHVVKSVTLSFIRQHHQKMEGMARLQKYVDKELELKKRLMLTGDENKKTERCREIKPSKRQKLAEVEELDRRLREVSAACAWYAEADRLWRFLLTEPMLRSDAECDTSWPLSQSPVDLVRIRDCFLSRGRLMTTIPMLGDVKESGAEKRTKDEKKEGKGKVPFYVLPWYVRNLMELSDTVQQNIFDPFLEWNVIASGMVGDEIAFFRCRPSASTGKKDSTSLKSPGNGFVGNDDLGNDQQQQSSRLYTAAQVRDALDASERGIFARMELSTARKALRNKLEAFQTFEEEVNGLAGRCGERPQCTTKTMQCWVGDEVLKQMKVLQRNVTATSMLPTDGTPCKLSNVPENVDLTLLNQAVTIREWILRSFHAQQVLADRFSRERLSFLQGVVRDAIGLKEYLKDVPPSACAVVHAELSRITNLKGTIDKKRCLDNVRCNFSVEELADYYSRLLDHDFMQKLSGVCKAVEEFGAFVAISEVEEKLLVRKDILIWKEDATKLARGSFPSSVEDNAQDASRDKPSHCDVEALLDRYNAIVKGGTSQGRSAVVSTLFPNDRVDERVKKFVLDDVNPLLGSGCVSILELVKSLASDGNSWKAKVSNFLNCGSGKPTAEREMDTLLKEYEHLSVSLPDEFKSLEAVKDESRKLKQGIEDAISTLGPLPGSLYTCMDALLSIRKNFILDCSKKQHIFDRVPEARYMDCWIEALQLHTKFIDALKRLDEGKKESTSKSLEEVETVARKIGEILGVNFDLMGRSEDSVLTVSPLGSDNDTKRGFDSSLGQLLQEKLANDQVLIKVVKILEWRRTASVILSRIKNEPSTSRPSLREIDHLIKSMPTTHPSSSEYVSVRCIDLLLGDAAPLEKEIRTCMEIDQKLKMALSESMSAGQSCYRKKYTALTSAAKSVGDATFALEHSLVLQVKKRIEAMRWSLEVLDHFENSDIKATVETMLPWDTLHDLFHKMPCMDDAADSKSDTVSKQMMEKVSVMYIKASRLRAELTIRATEALLAAELADRSSYQQKLSVLRETHTEAVKNVALSLERSLLERMKQRIENMSWTVRALLMSTSCSALKKNQGSNACGVFKWDVLDELSGSIPADDGTWDQVTKQVVTEVLQTHREGKKWLDCASEFLRCDDKMDVLNKEEIASEVKELLDDPVHLKILMPQKEKLDDMQEKIFEFRKETSGSPRINVQPREGSEGNGGNMGHKDVEYLSDSRYGEEVSTTAQGGGAHQLSSHPQQTPKSILLKPQGERRDQTVSSIVKESIRGQPLVFGKSAWPVKHRFELLDCLLSRQKCEDDEAHKTDAMPTDAYAFCSSVPDEGMNLRERTISYLFKSFLKGMQMLDINTTFPESSAYCALLSWKLEMAMFDKHTEGGRTDTTAYKAHCRSLGYNLVDPKNPTLCARVLLGRIDLDVLVNMTSEQMASKQTRAIREKAAQEATKNIVLVPAANGKAEATTRGQQGEETGVSKSLSSRSVRVGRCEHSRGSKLGRAARESDIASSKPGLHAPSNVDDESAEGLSNTIAENTVDKLKPLRLEKVISLHHSVNVAPFEDMHPPLLRARRVSSEIIKGNLPRGALPRHAPGTSTLERETSGSTSEQPIVSSTGERQFGFSAGQHIFAAQLVTDCMKFFESANRVLPPSFVGGDRVTIENFNNFMNKKTSSSHSEIVILRLSLANSSDPDKEVFRNYYSDYEGRKRIAMFSVSSDAKLFVVTPLFLPEVRILNHGGAKRVQGKTYVVLVLRKQNSRDGGKEDSSGTVEDSFSTAPSVQDPKQWMETRQTACDEMILDKGGSLSREEGGQSLDTKRLPVTLEETKEGGLQVPGDPRCLPAYPEAKEVRRPGKMSVGPSAAHVLQGAERKSRAMSTQLLSPILKQEGTKSGGTSSQSSCENEPKLCSPCGPSLLLSGEEDGACCMSPMSSDKVTKGVEHRVDAPDPKDAMQTSRTTQELSNAPDGQAMVTDEKKVSTEAVSPVLASLKMCERKESEIRVGECTGASCLPIAEKESHSALSFTSRKERPHRLDTKEGRQSPETIDEPAHVDVSEGMVTNKKNSVKLSMQPASKLLDSRIMSASSEHGTQESVFAGGKEVAENSPGDTSSLLNGTWNETMNKRKKRATSCFTNAKEGSQPDGDSASLRTSPKSEAPIPSPIGKGQPSPPILDHEVQENEKKIRSRSHQVVSAEEDANGLEANRGGNGDENDLCHSINGERRKDGNDCRTAVKVLDVALMGVSRDEEGKHFQSPSAERSLDQNVGRFSRQQMQAPGPSKASEGRSTSAAKTERAGITRETESMGGDEREINDGKVQEKVATCGAMSSEVLRSFDDFQSRSMTLCDKMQAEDDVGSRMPVSILNDSLVRNATSEEHSEMRSSLGKKCDQHQAEFTDCSGRRKIANEVISNLTEASEHQSSSSSKQNSVNHCPSRDHMEKDDKLTNSVSNRDLLCSPPKGQLLEMSNSIGGAKSRRDSARDEKMSKRHRLDINPQGGKALVGGNANDRGEGSTFDLTGDDGNDTLAVDAPSVKGVELAPVISSGVHAGGVHIVLDAGSTQDSSRNDTPEDGQAQGGNAGSNNDKYQVDSREGNDMLYVGVPSVTEIQLSPVISNCSISGEDSAVVPDSRRSQHALSNEQFDREKRVLVQRSVRKSLACDSSRGSEEKYIIHSGQSQATQRQQDHEQGAFGPPSKKRAVSCNETSVFLRERESFNTTYKSDRNGFPMLSDKKWMLSQVGTAKVCRFPAGECRGRRCHLAHTFKPRGPVPSGKPSEWALQRAYKEHCSIDLKGADFYVLNAVGVEQTWYTAALLCPADNIIYYAEGAGGRVSCQGISWYLSMTDAIAGVGAIVLESFTYAKIYPSWFSSRRNEPHLEEMGYNIRFLHSDGQVQQFSECSRVSTMNHMGEDPNVDEFGRQLEFPVDTDNNEKKIDDRSIHGNDSRAEQQQDVSPSHDRYDAAETPEMHTSEADDLELKAVRAAERYKKRKLA